MRPVTGLLADGVHEPHHEQHLPKEAAAFLPKRPPPPSLLEAVGKIHVGATMSICKSC